MTVFTVGWYLIHLATPAAMIAAGMSGGFWMIPIVFLLVAAAYYVGGRVLGRVIGRHAWLWAALAAVAPLVVELVAALVGGGSTADLPWARDPIWLSLQLLGPLAALLGARSFREASSAR